MRSHCTGIAALRQWLTPSVWKQAHQTQHSTQSAERWRLHPLVLVVVLITWTTGDSSIAVVLQDGSVVARGPG